MDREKAIQILKRCEAESHCEHYKRHYCCIGCGQREALDLAIEALKEPKPACEDCISRADTIKAMCSKCVINRECIGECSDVVAIKNMPSVWSERPKGEWVDYTEYGYVECPFCHSATNCDGNKDELHFCFSCGADMRGADDE